MKKILLLLMIASSLMTYSQSVKDVFEYKAITFFGLDFTEANCVGMGEFPGGNDMINIHYPEWNNIFMEGKDRVMIGKPYKKKIVDNDPAVYQFNKLIDPETIITMEHQGFKKTQIEEFVKKYSSSDKAGLGLVYMVESLNATDEFLSIWIVFFDLGSAKVLLSEPARAKGKGKRFEDYWSYAILEIYDNSAKDYKTWKKRYK